MSGQTFTEVILFSGKACRIAKVIVFRNCKYLVGQSIDCRTAAEGIGLEHCDAMRYADVLQRGYVIKSAIAYRRDALGYRHSLQALGNVGIVCLVSAGTEYIAKPGVIGILKSGTNERQSDLFKILAVLKRADAYNKLLCIGIGNGYLPDSQSHKGIVTYVNERFGDIELLYSRICECIIVYTEHSAVLADGNSFKRLTSVECEVRDLDDTVGNGYITEVLTSVECALIYSLEMISVSKDYLFKRGTVCKCIVVDRHDACGNCEAFYVLCAEERSVSKGKDIGIRIKSNIAELTVLKCAKADDLHVYGNGIDSASSRRECDQLSAVLTHKNAVNRLIVGVVLVHCKFGQVFKAYKSVLSYIANIGRDIYALESRVIEYVAFDMYALSASEFYRSKRHIISERAMIYKCYTIGNSYRCYLCTRKCSFGYLRKRCSLFKFKSCNSALFKYRSTESLNALGDNY